MTTSHDLAGKLVSAGLDRHRVQTFADAVSKLEHEAGVKVGDINPKGTPPFEGTPGVHFHGVSGDRLTKLLDSVLNSAHLNKNVLINGIPAPGHYNVSVFGGH